MAQPSICALVVIVLGLISMMTIMSLMDKADEGPHKQDVVDSRKQFNLDDILFGGLAN